MGQILLIIALIFGAAAGIGIEEWLVIPHVRTVQRNHDIRACNAKIARIGQEAEQAANDQVNAGRQAELSVGAGPRDDAAKLALCKRDVLCRENKK